jgi:hypothetical protein
MKRDGRVAGVLACLLGIAMMSSGAAIAQDASPTPTDSLTASPDVSSVSVVDVYPMDIGAGPVPEAEFVIARGEALFAYMLGAEPEPLDRLSLEEFATSGGEPMDAAILVNGWHRFPDANVNLAGFQVPGSEAAQLIEAATALGQRLMWDPEIETSRIADRDVTVFHTEESLGRLNYLVVTGDIAWFFVAPDAYVETVLEHLPG